MKKTIAVLLLFTLVIGVCGTVSASDPMDDIPVLSETYPGTSSTLRQQSGRTYSRLGPGGTYDTAGGYKTDSQHKNRLHVYFNENGWVLADIVYSTAFERFVYFPQSAVNGGSSLTPVYSLDYVDGSTTAMVSPSWGPSDSFNRNDDLRIGANTRLKIFFRENDYVYAEFTCAKGLARMWLPMDCVSVD